MSYLIDSLINSRTEIDGIWYIAKPMGGPLSWRIRNAWLVLTGKAMAVHFKETN
jgi:hypothetical protein